MKGALLRELRSDDAVALRRAVERASEYLKRSEVNEEERGAIGEELTRLAGHRGHRVREAVARAALHVSDAHFEQIVPLLRQDSHAFVGRSAARTFDERRKRRRSEQVRDERGSLIDRLFAKFERDFGEEARRAADHICERKTELFVLKMHHELAKVATSLEMAIVNARAESGRESIHREVLKANVETAFTKYQLLMAIVDAARSYATVVQPKLAPTRVAPLLGEAVELLRDRIGARATRLALTIDAGDEIMLDADRGALMQAFSNVLQNAVEAYADHSAAPIRIAIVARSPESGAEVSIAFTDQGAGIPKDALPHVCEPFTSGKGVGRGLGLSNARKMVEGVHGGTLTIESERGVGTTVTMVLPRGAAVAAIL